MSQTSALKALQTWFRANPGQTVFHVVNGAIFLAPALITVPALAGLGLRMEGPVSGMAAPAIMSWLGCVKAGGVFATMQSAAMGGYGTAAVAGASQAGAAMSSAAVAYRTYLLVKRRRGPKL
ncbi:hypothetical protein EK21DRAFT_64777 [Setomelanomma holmii]|uniref:Uncharacterized protein n=1 Tax=Setomelanomma holmii TaxID=210430 RepID=A0A9P4HAT4_9PLEO|nr:hypothetical protein EK21DRAFT_64777 [Setomelanomma holmii]